MNVGEVFASLGFRYDDSGADRFERRFEKIKRESKRPITAEAKVDVDQRGFGRFSRSVRDADRSASRFEKTGGRVRRGLGGVGRAAAAAGGAVGFAGLALGVKKAVSEYEEAAKVGAQTRAVIRSTGGAANVSADDVERLAGALSNKTAIDDEVIQKGANMLLTFTNVRNEAGRGNDIFNQATSILTDMSVALGTDASKSAIQLGKALNDPVKGVTALQRVGVTFTDQQKQQIKTLVESGRTMDAQKIILRELNKEFGGSAEAQARPLDRAKVAVDNLFEAIGKHLAPVVADAAGGIADFIGQLESGEGVGGKVAAVFRGVGNAVDWIADRGRDVIGFFRGLGNEGAGGAGKVGNAIRDARGFLGDLWNTVKGVASGVARAFDGVEVPLREIGEVLRDVFVTAFGFVTDVIGRALPGIKAMFGGLARIVRGVIDVIAGILTLDFSRIWDGVKGILGGAIRVVGGIIRTLTAPFREVVARIAGFVGRAFSAVVGAVVGAGRGVGRGVASIVRFIGSLPGRIWGFLRRVISRVASWTGDFVSRAAHAGRRFLGRVIDFISDLPGRVWRFLRRVVSRAASWVGDMAATAARAGRRFLGRVIDFISDLPGKVWSFLKRAVGRAGDFAGDLAKAAGRAGRGFVEGVVNWVKGLPGKLFNLAKDAGRSLLRGLKNVVPKPLRRFIPGLARGGVLRHPQIVVAGEEAPQHPEYYISTNPRDRARSISLWAELGERLGLPIEFNARGRRRGGAPRASPARRRGGGQRREWELPASAYEVPFAQSDVTVAMAEASPGPWDDIAAYNQRISLIHGRIAEIEDWRQRFRRRLARKPDAHAGLLSEKASLISEAAGLQERIIELQTPPAPDVPIDTGDPGAGTPTGPTPEEIAAGIAAALASYQQQRGELLAGFGGNFWGARGQVVLGPEGLRLWGASGAGGGVSVQQMIEFREQPQDHFGWSRRAAHQASLAFGG